MHLLRLKLHNFRNYSDYEVGLTKGVICVCGSNGTGKTNFLDSVYYASTAKSSFNPIDSQNICQGKQVFRIEADFKSGDHLHKVACAFGKAQKKKVSLNGHDYDRITEHYGKFPVIMIAPQHLNLINEGSEERRRFLDSTISLYDNDYLQDLLAHRRFLQQRNSALKAYRETGRWDAELNDIYEQKLLSHGQAIYQKRKDFIEELNPVFGKTIAFINEGFENLSFDYRTQFSTEDPAFLFKRHFERDRMLARTSVGIHKDELRFRIGNEALKKFGSQGQQKSFLIALKLAQAAIAEEKTGIRPIMLLDDFFDRLDEKRSLNLMNIVCDRFEQIIISDTSKSRLQKALGKRKALFIDSDLLQSKKGKGDIVVGQEIPDDHDRNGD